ncbi:MAG: thioredoxin family protein [Oligoflexia bacterium]|nr:thioredoxin family protein [Oligoflexia bacterium]
MDIAALMIALPKLAYAFGMGLVSTCTPCVYPMIPITLSILGATASVSRKQAFLVSSSYVGGIVLTYTALGLLCAKTGMMFGSLLSSPAVVIGLCLFLAILTLHTLDIVSLPLARLQSKASAVGGRGYSGAFVMGVVSGAVAAPCVGPVLVLILVEAAKSASTVWGASLLFFYSLGLGLPFLIFGTFSGLLKKIPRSGNWMYGVKYLIALALIVTILYFLNTLDLGLLNALEQSVPRLAWGALAAVGLVAAVVSTKRKIKLPQLVSAFILAICIYFGNQNTAVGSTNVDRVTVAWEQEIPAALEIGKAVNKPVMVDLKSKWCMACKELEHTFAEARVANQLHHKFVAAQIDFTKTTEKTKAISEKYNVVGLPCVLFLNPDGSEIAGTRITGAVKSEELLGRLSQIESEFGRRSGTPG